MEPVGYLLNTKTGMAGKAGLYYDYIFAETGVFIRAQNPLLRATLCISPAEIRGLAPLDEEIELTHGRIPRSFYDLAISALMVNWSLEQFLAVTWDGQYHLTAPTQTREPGAVTYNKVGSTVLDIHSHGAMKAWFSGTDNKDDLGLCLYMVVGRLDTFVPDVEMRLGVYGYHAPVYKEDIFDV